MEGVVGWVWGTEWRHWSLFIKYIFIYFFDMKIWFFQNYVGNHWLIDLVCQFKRFKAALRNVWLPEAERREKKNHIHRDAHRDTASWSTWWQSWGKREDAQILCLKAFICLVSKHIQYENISFSEWFRFAEYCDITDPDQQNYPASLFLTPHLYIFVFAVLLAWHINKTLPLNIDEPITFDYQLHRGQNLNIFNFKIHRKILQEPELPSVLWCLCQKNKKLFRVSWQ